MESPVLVYCPQTLYHWTFACQIFLSLIKLPITFVPPLLFQLTRHLSSSLSLSLSLSLFLLYLSFLLLLIQDYSVVQIDPLIEPLNVQHVHHFIAHICTNITGGYQIDIIAGKGEESEREEEGRDRGSTVRSFLYLFFDHLKICFAIR
jgi:hypothetical protein